MAAVEAARNEVAYARTARDAATVAWIAEIESVYGELVVLHGRQGAERFFPRGRRGAGDPEEAEEVEEAEAAEAIDTSAIEAEAAPETGEAELEPVG